MNKSYQRSKEERQRLAESVEQRGLAEGNTPQPTTTGTQRPDTVSSGLQRVRETAQRDNYAVPYNLDSLNLFRYELSRAWLRTLRRRSQKARSPT